MFASHPYLLAISTMPFQEMVMLAALLWAVHCYYSHRAVAASVCLGSACLTRFEAWMACPALIVAELKHQGLGVRQIVRACCSSGGHRSQGLFSSVG